MLETVAYSPTLNMYVAGGYPTAFYRSTDGQDWTQVNFFGGLYAIRRIKWYVNQFVAVSDGGRIFTSPNGITWTQRASLGTNINDLTWSGSLYVAVGDSGLIVTSPDTVT